MIRRRRTSRSLGTLLIAAAMLAGGASLVRAQAAARQVGEHGRSVVPCTRASSMARPETPSTWRVTLVSFTLASCSTLCRRFATRVRSWCGFRPILNAKIGPS